MFTFTKTVTTDLRQDVTTVVCIRSTYPTRSNSVSWRQITM